MHYSFRIKSYYSLLSSLNSIDDMIEYATSNDLKYLSLCDTQLYGALEFYKKCTNANIKPIIGIEVMVDGNFVTVIAKNYDGYKNLMKLSTFSSVSEDIKFDDFISCIDNVFILISYKNLDFFYKVFEICNSTYLYYDDIKDESKCLEVTDKVVYSNEVLCLNFKDESLLKYVYMIRDSKTVNSELNYDLSNKCFRKINVCEVVSNNMNYIISSCYIDFPKSSNLIPIYDVDDPREYLRSLAFKGLNRRFNNNVDSVYIDRLNYELEIIDNMGFSNYFLVVYDFIKYAKLNHILVGPGRGSAAGSLVSFCLGITDIDPIKFDLLFERFLNPERKTMPDIDTDFPDIYRDDVINYVKNKYGEKRVAGIVTFGTLAPRLVLRDVARLLEIPLNQVEIITKKIPSVTKMSLKDFYLQDADIKKYVDNDERIGLLFKIASRIEGFPRHTSSHAAGIIMSKVDLDQVIPLTWHDGMYLSGYTMEYLEELGLLKMDFLGIKNLTTIMNIIDDIKKYEGYSIDFNKIPLDDPKVFELFSKGDTTGIFQFESDGMKNFLKNLKPSCFEDIFAAIALFRPGPSSNIDLFIKRKEGKEEVTYIDECMKPILQNTYGIIVYQEQIMQISQVFAGYTLGEADILRRAMSKKKLDVLKQEETKFIKKSMEHGHSLEKSKEVYELILRFANYGFNRSHSVAYSVIACKMAFLKVYFPKYFYANLLTSVIGVDAKTKEYIREVRGKNINVLTPDINLSMDFYKVEKDGIRFPLSNIRNIGTVACNEILENRKNSYNNIFDFFKLSSQRIINKKNIESLIDASVFDSFGYNHQTLYKNLDEILNYSSLVNDLGDDCVLEPEIIEYEEFDKQTLIEKEKDVFGFYLSTHPVSLFKGKYETIVNLNEISKFFGKKIYVIGLVDSMRKIITKNNKEMAFLYISDEYDGIDLTLFPDILNKHYDIKNGDIIYINASVERRYDKFQLVANDIKILNKSN